MCLSHESIKILTSNTADREAKKKKRGTEMSFLLGVITGLCLYLVLGILLVLKQNKEELRRQNLEAFAKFLITKVNDPENGFPFDKERPAA